MTEFDAGVIKDLDLQSLIIILTVMGIGIGAVFAGIIKGYEKFNNSKKENSEEHYHQDIADIREDLKGYEKSLIQIASFGSENKLALAVMQQQMDNHIENAPNVIETLNELVTNVAVITSRLNNPGGGDDD